MLSSLEEKSRENPTTSDCSSVVKFHFIIWTHYNVKFESFLVDFEEDALFADTQNHGLISTSQRHSSVGAAFPSRLNFAWCSRKRPFDVNFRDAPERLIKPLLSSFSSTRGLYFKLVVALVDIPSRAILSVALWAPLLILSVPMMSAFNPRPWEFRDPESREEEPQWLVISLILRT